MPDSGSVLAQIQALLLILACFNWVAVNSLPGSWEILFENAGISTMHAAVTRFGTVVLLDRTDIGTSKILLGGGRCRRDPTEKVLKIDCTAHSVLFDPSTNKIRPLTILTDTWCSSGQFAADGTLIQTGGDFDGRSKIRKFSPCAEPGGCDWIESSDSLAAGRWYATNQLLPDGRIIVIGGRDVFNYEFVPRSANSAAISLPFLSQTHDMQIDNLYPYVHLLPDGSLFIFANRDSIRFDYNKNRILQEYPTIPGEPRCYPSAGSSVMLPLLADTGFSTAEILVCGGAQLGAFLNPQAKMPASQTCGRIMATDPNNPQWTMEDMPFRRTMGDMIILPSRHILIINGAVSGSQGFGLATEPCLNPVLYKPDDPAGLRFMVLEPSNIARLYHSTACLLADARILVAGGNTHYFYTFTGDFPTELRIEAFSPEYLSSDLANLRPSIIGAPLVVFYGLDFTVTITTELPITGIVELNLVSAPFTTHSYGQGQRLIKLAVLDPVSIGDGTYTVTGTGPSNPNVAPSSYYMLFAVNQGIPSMANWVHVRS